MSNNNQNLPFDESNPHIKKFLSRVNSRFMMRFFMLFKLPSALFMGLKVKSVTLKEAQVTVPYGWRSQNPFQSTYFAAQAAAAEMSTGVLGLAALSGRGNISMLITKIEGTYGKKANKLATFVCQDGDKIIAAVQKAIDTKEGQEVVMTTIGTQMGEDGKLVEVSRFQFTWSFKAKK